MTFWCGSGSRSGSTNPCFWLIDPDADPSIFIIDLQDANKKLFKKVFLHISFEGTFTSFCKDKKSKRSHKTVKVKVFLIFLLNNIRIRIWIHTSDLWIRIQIQEAQNMWIRIRIWIRNTGSEKVACQYSFKRFYKSLFSRTSFSRLIFLCK